MGKKIALYLIAPALVAAAVAGAIYWSRTTSSVQTQVASDPARVKARHDFTLEVMGVGLAVSDLRQINIWDAMEKNPGAFALPVDFRKRTYDWPASTQWEEGTLAPSAAWLGTQWAVPAFVAGPAIQDAKIKAYQESIYTNAKWHGWGMHWRQFPAIGHIYDNHTDTLLEQAFAFFEANPLAPVAALYGGDSRELRRQMMDVAAGEKIADHNSQIEAAGGDPRDLEKNDPTEAMAVLILVRRDRIDALRPYAVDANTGKQVGPAPARPFQSTTWLPKPWTQQQFEQFDRMPTLGFLHWPQNVPYLNDHGSPLRGEARSAVFRQGWQQAMRDLPPDAKVARVFYTAGAEDRETIVTPLTQTLASETHLNATQAGQGFNLVTNLGDTGAAAPFVQLVLALYASYRHHDVSASVNLNRRDGASIVLITPPLDTPRQPAGDPQSFKLLPPVEAEK